MPVALVSTRSVIQRWRDAVEQVMPVQGNLYYIAPGTSSFNVARRLVTPSDNADGLTPFTPLATVNEYLNNRVVSNDGDVGVLMRSGTYTLGANVISTKHRWGLMAAPGLHPRGVSVVGITGAEPIISRGDYITLMGFSLNSGDASYGNLTFGGDYNQFIRMMFDSSASVTPLWGLRPLSPLTSQTTSTASFWRAIACHFADCATGLLFAYQSGLINSESITDWEIDGCIFRKNSTRDVGQTATVLGVGNRVQGGLLHNSVFMGPIGTDFIKLDNATNGNDQINAICDNTFLHNAITATQVLLTNTTTAFKFTGNRDKTGFITGV